MSFKRYFFGSLCCLVAVLSWGGMFPIMAPALKVIDPFYFTLLRYGVVALIFAVCLVVVEGKAAFRVGDHAWLVWLLGTAAFAGFSFCVFLGQKVAGPAGTVIAAVMMAVQPLLGVLVNWCYRRQRPRRLTIIAIILAVAGVILVMTKGHPALLVEGGMSTLLAAGLILFGALCWVIYTTGSTIFPEWSILRYSTLTSLYGMISVVGLVAIATLFGWLSLPSCSQLTQITFPWLYMVTLAGIVAVFSWNMGSRLLRPINSILFMNLVPLTAFAITVMQGYMMSASEGGGCLLVIIALVINNLALRQR